LHVAVKFILWNICWGITEDKKGAAITVPKITAIFMICQNSLGIMIISNCLSFSLQVNVYYIFHFFVYKNC